MNEQHYIVCNPVMAQICRNSIWFGFKAWVYLCPNQVVWPACIAHCYTFSLLVRKGRAQVSCQTSFSLFFFLLVEFFSLHLLLPYGLPGSSFVLCIQFIFDFSPFPTEVKMYKIPFSKECCLFRRSMLLYFSFLPQKALNAFVN